MAHRLVDRRSVDFQRLVRQRRLDDGAADCRCRRTARRRDRLRLCPGHSEARPVSPLGSHMTSAYRRKRARASIVSPQTSLRMARGLRGNKRSLMQPRMVNELLDHEIRNIFPGNASTVDVGEIRSRMHRSGGRLVVEHGWPDDHPIKAASTDLRLLSVLVLINTAQQARSDADLQVP